MATVFTRTFNETGDFAAMSAAEEFLAAYGFSIGSNQRGAPRGIMFGDYLIGKWRDLDREERRALHGALMGDGRNGPLTLEIYNNVPAEGLSALKQSQAA